MGSKRLSAGVAAALGTLLLAGAVEAGTPYTCNCSGAKKRFIGGSHACEITRDHPKEGVVARKLRPCNEKEWRRFVRQACAESKCTPYRW